MMNWRIGVDLGGTKTEAVAIDGTGRERLRRRIPSPGGDYGATIATIAQLGEAMENELGRRTRVGVGIPGTISPATGLVKNANSTWLIGHPLDQDLAEALSRPVRIANDADCFALSEASDGAGAGAPVVFGVILGTGVGGGIVVNGRLLSGPNAIAGEWGHNPLPWPLDDERPGPTCYCGRSGCIETFLSGPALTHDDGRGVTARDLASRDDDQSAQSLARYEHRLARALAHVINLIDPHVIVLGGGLSNIERLYETVPRLWGRWIFSDNVQTRLCPPRHGDSSGVRGAAWLWPVSDDPPPAASEVPAAVRAVLMEPMPPTIWLTRESTAGEGGATGPGAAPQAGTEADDPAKLHIDLQLTRRELAAAKAEAALADAAKSRFLAAASHDLRQPFQAMNLYLQVLETLPQEDRARKALALLRTSMEAGEELLQALLDISAFEAGIIAPNVTRFPIAPLLDELAGEYHCVALEHGLSFRTFPVEAVVETDRVLAKRMCRNLVHNAFRYTRDGGILIGCRRRGARILVQVFDTGPGIPADKLQMIFEDFYQLDNPARDRSKGLGLGLSIVQRTAHLLGQDVWVASRPGHGSVFSVTLPLATSHSGNKP
ncbi:MAG: ROK family protein [Telmatospirillum sp.]|nr:ROK family protein [Telmatospirillum sp.]